MAVRDKPLPFFLNGTGIAARAGLRSIMRGFADLRLMVLRLIFCWIVMSPSTSRIWRLIRGSGRSQSIVITPKLSPQFIVATRWRFTSKGRHDLASLVEPAGCQVVDRVAHAGVHHR